MAIGTPTQRAAQAREFGSAALVTPAFTPVAGSLLLLIADSADLTITGHDTLSAWVDATPAGMTALRLYAALVGGSPSSGSVSVDDAADSTIAFRLFEITGFDTQTDAASCLRSDFTNAYDTVHSIDLGVVSKMTMAFFRYGGEKPTLENTEISPDLNWYYGGAGLVAEYAASGDSVHTATLTSNFTIPGIALELIDVIASNQDPVADDDTFSIPENAQNGDVVGTYTATDSDGTVVSYSITGTQLAINNAGQITIADNTGFTAGQQIIETVTATDDDGATDPATITVNITAVVLSYSVDNANPEEGETVTLTIANGTGPFTATFDGTAITLATQSQGAATIAWPNMQTHGSRYNQAADLVLTDTSNGQTHTVQITPAVTAGHDFAVITAMTGIGADDTDVVVGDERVGYVVSGTFEHVDLATGALMSAGGGTYRYNTFDVSAGVWLGAVDEVIAPPSLSVVSADSTMQRGTNYQVTIQGPPITPTTSNSSLVSGNDSLACTLVEDLGNAQYRLTFAVGDLSKQVNATGYNWSVRVENS